MIVGMTGCVDPTALAPASPSPLQGGTDRPTQPVPCRPGGAPVATRQPSAAPTATATAAVSDLQALLPQFAGPDADLLDRRTLTAADLQPTGDGDSTGFIFQRVLADLDVPGDAVEVAVANGPTYGFLAIRVDGMAAADVRGAFERVATEDEVGGVLDTLTVGDEEIRRVGWIDADVRRAYLMVVDDVLIVASASGDDEALVIDTFVAMLEPKLEIVLPARLDGRDLTRFTVPAAAVSRGGDICTIVCPMEIPNLAAAVGADVADMDLAFAYLAEPPGIVILAIRVPGVEAGRLVAGRIAASGRADEPQVHPMPLSVAGKEVTWVDYSLFEIESEREYLYAAGDILFSIRPAPKSGGAPSPIVEAAIAALP